MLNIAVAPLAFSKAARLGRGAMTLGAMPCPARRGRGGASAPGQKAQKWTEKDVCGGKREDVLDRSKKKTKKGKFVRQHHINSKTTSLCVQKQQQQQSHHNIISKQAAV